MMTKAIFSAAAFCMLTLAQAQEGTTPVTTTTGGVQDPLTSHASVYHTCLLNAGTETWKVLGLDAQQAGRVADLQARYKTSLNPPKEEKTKGKKSKATAEKAPKAVVAEPVSTQVSTGAEKETMDPMKQPAEGAVEATTLDGMPAVASVDEELRSILTPEQLALWEKKCSASESTGALVPQE